jgi:SRSO17 transposase
MQIEFDSKAQERRFEAYMARLITAVEHADRAEPLRAYVTGLIAPGDRKSVEPMAALIDPKQVQRRHQSMLHIVGVSPWSDRAVLQVAYDQAKGPITDHGPVDGMILDDTGLPKKGRHSVGVARQYCGVKGKQDNCQVVVSLSIGNDTATLPVGYRLYLTKEWAEDMDRRRKCGVPDDVAFQEKWQIGLSLIDEALASGKPRVQVLADAGYGDTTDFRDGLTTRELPYVVGVHKETSVWPPGTGPLPPKSDTGKRGTVPKRLRRDNDHQPISALDLAKCLDSTEYAEITWREGTKGEMTSRFAAVRVRPAHRDYCRTEPRPVEWLLIEWPAGEKEPAKYWLSTLDETTPQADLVRTAKMRWRIERDYQELKDELGIDHYEGRGWRGIHHHWALCIAAYAFLVAERGLFSPLGPRGGNGILGLPALPSGFRPRGAPSGPTAPADVHHDAPHRSRHGADSRPGGVPDVQVPAGAASSTNGSVEDSGRRVALMT